MNDHGDVNGVNVTLSVPFRMLLVECECILKHLLILATPGVNLDSDPVIVNLDYSG